MRTILSLILTTVLIGLAAAEGKVLTITSEQQFDEVIAASKGKKEIVVVDFWAEWCGPCRQLGPVLEGVAAENVGKLVVLKVDVDAVPALAQRFQITSIPALHKYQNGEKTDESLGSIPKEALVTWLGL